MRQVGARERFRVGKGQHIPEFFYICISNTKDMRVKLSSLVCGLLAISGLFMSCEDQEQEILIQSITLSQPSAQMYVGETISLKALVTPSTALDGLEIVWASSNQSVATITQDGVITAIAEGTTTISATAGGKTGSCLVTVVKRFVGVTSIELDRTELAMVEDDEVTLRATVMPEDATDKTVSWSSSDSSVAFVDDTGKVKAVKEGETVITARAGEHSAECKVVVSAKKIDVTMVMLNRNSLDMIVGDEFTLVATIIPVNATVQTIQWSTSDSSIATVDEEGKVIAIKEGGAKIVAYVDGKTAECNVTVSYIPVQSITFDKPSLALYEGEEYTLTATIEPKNATYQDITWTTNDSKVATVEEGKVIAVKKGTATIKAEANGKFALCQVEVLSSIAEISLDKNELSMIVGDTETLTAIITPADATLREKIVWTSYDETIVTVDDAGKVKAVKEGNAVVSAMVEGKKAECNVSVDYVHVASIDISQSEATLYIGESLTISATLNPSNVTYNTIEWASSNEDVVKVSETGRVTAVGKGTVVVSALSDGKEAKCSFTVLVPLAGLSFDQASLTLFNGATTTLSVIKAPADATLRGEINWSSSNTSVATVNENGLVTAVNMGSANITASVDGCSATCPVTVLASVTGISLSKTSATLNKGESVQLSYSVVPTGATLQGQVSWVSSAPSVATVDSQGNVKAISAGTADITVSLEGFTATCKITVVVPVSSVSLNKTSLSMNKGETATLVATVSPSDATDKTVSWASSDSEIVAVDNKGEIMAKAGGTATITVTASGKTATCQVTVSVPVSSVALNQTSVTIVKGETCQLIATVYPSDATDKSVTWSTSNKAVATVSESGVVSAVDGGMCEIIVRAGNKEARCAVTVTVPVSSVSLNKTSVSLNKGETTTIVATVYPENATDKSVTWRSSNASVASVDGNGKITAVGGGSAIITAGSGGKTADCSVTVSVPVTSVSLNRTEITIVKGNTYDLSATISPNDATDKTITWTSSDDNVATVNQNGRVTAIDGGEAIVRATIGNFYADCKVVVTVPVSALTLSSTELSLVKGQTFTLTATVGPDNATDKTVTWSTSNETVAIVEDGVVTALKSGQARITAKAGGITARCTVSVTTPVTSISLDRTSITLDEGQSTVLVATVSPYDADDKTVTWSSSNTSVARVYSDGTVMAKREGEAIITAVSGAYSASCSVTVSKSIIPVSSVSLDRNNLSLIKGESATLVATVYPYDATDRTVTWTSSDATIASVDQNGRVVALAGGTVNIKAAAGDQYAICSVVITVPVSSVTIDKSSMTLVKGETATLTATVNPWDASEKMVTWSSSNTSVATVDEVGTVTAVDGGTATIAATAGGKTAMCAVTVTVPVSSVSLNKESAVIVKGNTLTLTATVSPSNATDKSVTWTSSDVSVATVNSNGVVTAVDGGSAVIRATAEGKYAECQITVTVPVSSVSLDKSSLSMIKGETASLVATVNPYNATDKSVTWTSSNTSVAKVTDGLVEAVGGGSAVITVNASGKTATCSVTVTVPVSSVSLDKSTLDLIKGESATLVATVNPSDATDKTVTWASSDSNVARVSNGLVEAVGGGSAVITVNASGKTATCAVTVTVPVSSISLDKSSVTLKQNETVQLTATVSPSDATDKTVTWTSSNTTVASVDSSGRVKALKEGSAVITAKAGDMTATCSITVSNNTSGGGHEGTGTETWN